jgi:uncharacterized protein YecT (DUF1311 family)
MMRTLLLATMLCIPMTASAKEHDCFDLPTNLEVDRCLKRDLAHAEEQLSAAIAKVTRKLDAKERRVFNESQNSWKVYRDKHCAFVASIVEGGRMQPLIEAQCRVGLTKERIAAVDSIDVSTRAE